MFSSPSQMSTTPPQVVTARPFKSSPLKQQVQVSFATAEEETPFIQKPSSQEEQSKILQFERLASKHINRKLAVMMTILATIILTGAFFYQFLTLSSIGIFDAFLLRYYIHF